MVRLSILGVETVKGDCLECHEPFELNVEILAAEPRVGPDEVSIEVRAGGWSVVKGCDHVEAVWQESLDKLGTE